MLCVCVAVDGPTIRVREATCALREELEKVAAEAQQLEEQVAAETARKVQLEARHAAIQVRVCVPVTK